MISIDDAKPGLVVYYQARHQTQAEHGVITSINNPARMVRVRFGTDDHSKSCNLRDLFWPSNFVAAEPPGQKYGDTF